MWDYLTPKDLAPAPAPMPQTPKILTATLPADMWDNLLLALELAEEGYLKQAINDALTVRPSPTIDALNPDEWARIRAAVDYALRWSRAEQSVGLWTRAEVREAWTKLTLLTCPTRPVTCPE